MSTGCQKDRNIERQTDRQTDRLTDRQIEDRTTFQLSYQNKVAGLHVKVIYVSCD